VPALKRKDEKFVVTDLADDTIITDTETPFPGIDAFKSLSPLTRIVGCGEP
jgi:hypothetical protein